MTVIGPPGIGKTRLAIETAPSLLSNFPDGVYFVALAPLDRFSNPASTIAQVLGYVEAKGLPIKDQLVQGIAGQSLLLVLDNCEHLLEELAPLAFDLLSACPQLNILATSREALKVPGEWLFSLSTLPFPQEGALIERDATGMVATGIPSAGSTTAGFEDIRKFHALTLFSERARAVRPEFSINPGNLQDIASICRKLDGLPLAIELLAARMRFMSPQALLERLTDQQDRHSDLLDRSSVQYLLSADGRRAVPERQKTLGQAIGWSYDFLDSTEQRLFSSLSVFNGGFSLEAAEAIFSTWFPGNSVSDLVTSLADKSLVQETFDARGDVRFGMLETIRQFAATKLFERGDQPAVRDQHLAYFTDYCEEGETHVHGPDLVAWIDRLERENDNLRAALEWGVSTQKTEAVLRLMGALGWPWEVRGHYGEARCWLSEIRALPDLPAFPLRVARLLNHIGRHCWTQDNLQDAYSLLEESYSLAEHAGAEGELILGEAANWLGLVQIFDGKPDSARALLEQALQLNQKWADAHGIALSTFHLGILENNLGKREEALELLLQSLSLYQGFGDLFFIARVSLFLGYLFLNQGDFDRAREYFESHLELDTRIQFWDGIAEGWRDLGYLYRAQGDEEKARECFENCRLVCQDHGLVKTIP